MKAKTDLVLETERLILRPVVLEDADDMYLYARTYQVTRMTRFKPHQNVEDTKQVIKNVFLSRPQKGWPEAFAITLKNNGRMIGTCDFWPISESEGVYEMGYALNPRFWGLGLMTEAATAVLDFAFNTYDVRRMELKHLKCNPASGAVARKIGFIEEGIKRQAAKFEDGYDDIVCYGLLKEEYDDRETGKEVCSQRS
ncbi:GNAT family N-acetyltransferase [Erysipelothrix rhusiopathiae]|uniref:GNAT family N-acetyltransferase n=1 Tax=Erysipelothrix TaxID=1647 RepID=UPI0013773377|nr:GNAT family protein [Erysipelothrix sp. strain 2 (EsS2-7-Brazil)]MBK2404711.1 N-acetyltransferase [Erysipelothrix sp. strain 2 (EsS2-7-Brazil)]NBA01911.1 GNAT family N-acetyltransferase [Erysipelothrix rhusiopathiae]